jgi:6-phosphogluconolactonase|tara:strand:+ start:178 stop:906 length:729 start_codon:yes stop_codon:yes gene_type:complete
MGAPFEIKYGSVKICSLEEIFQITAEKISAVASGVTKTVGLTGGSTPKAFYEWAAETKPFSEEVLNKVLWYASDERMVPLDSEESNFGIADRKMLTFLDVSEINKHPWITTVDPQSSANVFNQRWLDNHGANHGFDLCLLGMGDDGHTASIFPGSTLLVSPIAALFACVEVPEKGWRLTITREGFGQCAEILITVTGAKKASVLKEVLEGPDDVYPVQLLEAYASRVTWLVDEAAAAELNVE